MANRSSIASLSGSLSLQVVTQSADYNEMINLPTINGVLLKGDMTSKDLGIERGYDAVYNPEDESLTLTT